MDLLSTLGDIRSWLSPPVSVTEAYQDLLDQVERQADRGWNNQFDPMTGTEGLVIAAPCRRR